MSMKRSFIIISTLLAIALFGCSSDDKKSFGSCSEYGEVQGKCGSENAAE